MVERRWRVARTAAGMCAPSGMRAGGREGCDERLVECGEVIGLATGDDHRRSGLTHDDRLVDPSCAGIAQIGLQARPTGQPAAADHVGLDEGPGAMADDGDRLAGVDEGLDERDSVGSMRS